MNGKACGIACSGGGGVGSSLFFTVNKAVLWKIESCTGSVYVFCSVSPFETSAFYILYNI